jgi:hypothetical protein
MSFNYLFLVKNNVFVDLFANESILFKFNVDALNFSVLKKFILLVAPCDWHKSSSGLFYFLHSYFIFRFPFIMRVFPGFILLDANKRPYYLHLFDSNGKYLGYIVFSYSSYDDDVLNKLVLDLSFKIIELCIDDHYYMYVTKKKNFNFLYNKIF